MKREIVRQVRRTFPPDQADTVLQLLATYGSEPYHRETTRVQRDILMLSGSDVDKIRHYVAEALLDYRDVLSAAEYPPDPDGPKTYEEWRSRLRLPPEEEPGG